MSVGLLLLVFPTALYFNRGPLTLRFGGRAMDAQVGFAGGILRGRAGLSGLEQSLKSKGLRPG